MIFSPVVEGSLKKILQKVQSVNKFLKKVLDDPN